MKNCYKKAMSLLLALALVVSIVPAIPAAAAGLPEAAQTAMATAQQDAAKAKAADATMKAAVEAYKADPENNPLPEKCPFCGQAKEWVEVTSDAAFGTGDTHLYLTDNVTYSGTGSEYAFINGAGGTGTRCVFLNGYNVTATAASAFNIRNGKINIIGYGSTITGYSNNSAYGAAVRNSSVNADNIHVANLYGGTYCGTFGSNAATCSVIRLSSQGGTINMYAGTRVQGNAANGYTVRILGGGTIADRFNMYGGEIIGNNIKPAVHMDATAANSNVQFKQYAGQISGGSQYGVSITKDNKPGCSEYYYIYGGTVTSTKAPLYKNGGAKEIHVYGGIFEINPTTIVAGDNASYQAVKAGYKAYEVSINGATRYLVTAEGAIEVAADKSYIKLLDNVEIADVSNIPVDLNGYTLTVGNGTVTAFDSANDEYEASEGKVVGATSVETDYVAPNGNRYIALEENGAYSLHRLNLRLTNATLRAGTDDKNMGLYYKAAVSCDDTLAGKVDAYGVVLSLEDMPGDDFLTAAGDKYTVVENGLEMNEAHTAVTNSGSVFGIMKKTNKASVNTEHGEMDIYANAYLVVDGKLVLADTENGGTKNGVAYSLYDVLKLIDDNWTKDYTEAQQQTVRAFYSYWNEYGMTWEFKNIGK